MKYTNPHAKGHQKLLWDIPVVAVVSAALMAGSKENQRKLFKNSGFTTRGTNEEKGTGLGLSICRELVELNNGSIWVESEPNLGSKFFVELPKVKPVS